MVLQLDNVDGLENLQPDWAKQLPVIRRYTPAIERWRAEAEAQMPESLRRRGDAAQLLDKFLWTMSGENAAGDPTIFHDGGNGYGLMADRVSRTPPGSAPDVQLRNAWNLVANNPRQWTDWGEGSSYQGKAFGALGVIAPYDPDPGAVHPTQGGQRRISPPDVGDEGLASATTQPPGWEPPAGYTSGVPIEERLRQAREKRLRETGYLPPTGTTDTGAIAGLGFGATFEANPTTDEQRAQRDRVQAVEDWGQGGNLVERGASGGLGLVSDVFNLGSQAISSARLPTSAPSPGGRQTESVSLADIANTPLAPGVTRFAGDVASAAVKPFDFTRLSGGIGGPGGPPSLAEEGVLQQGARLGAEGTIDTSPLGLALTVPGALDAGARIAPKLYDEAAVRLAANETFDRLAPASVLRHERAGAAIAQEAAGIPVDVRSPFARTQRGGTNVVEGITEGQAARLARGETVQMTRQQGARAGAVAGPEVAGGSAGRDAYSQLTRKNYATKMGEDEAKRMDARLARQGQTWADFGDATRAFDTATPSHEIDPGSASVTQGTKALRPDGTVDYDQLTKEIRQAVADVRAERISQGTRDELARASAAIREEGARTGRQYGPEVSGGRGTGGETPRLDAARANVEQLHRNLVEMAREGEGNRFWYEIGSQAFMRAAQHDVPKATRMAWIAAMGSPQTEVLKQGKQIMKAWGQALRGEPIAVHTAAQNARINKILDLSPEELDNFVVTLLKPKPTAAESKAMKAAGLDTERGRKTANFFLDLLDGIDPERGARIRELSGRSGTTNDLHMARAVFGHGVDPKKDALTEPEYTFIEDLTKGVAKELGWDNKQAQAAIWASDIYRDPARKLSVADAAATYADALKKNRAIVSWESAPGKGTAFSAKLPSFEHWSYAQQLEFHDAVSKAFLDDNGDNILAKAVGIPGGMIHYGPGFYEGQVHPGAAFDVYLHPNMYDKVDQLAALTGYVTQQTAVPWSRPVFKANAGAHNGVVLNMGRPMTVEEGMLLQNTLGDGFVVVQGPESDIYAFRIQGDADFAARDLPSSSPDFKAMAQTNKDARKQIEDTVKEVWDNDLEVRQSPAAFDGNYLENDWTVAPNGESYLSAAPAAQSPDVRTALGTLRARLQATVDEFALRHAADPAIGLRDPRFDYGELQPVTGLVARQRDVTRTRGAAWVDPQGQIWLNNAPEHVDAVLGGREKGTLNTFTDVMGDGWVRVTSTKNPDSPIRQLSIHGFGDENTRKGADALINSLPESARSTTEIVISPRPDQSEFWMGTAQDWLDQGKPVRTAGPFDAPLGPDSPDISAADIRRAGARVGREQGAEVGGGSAFRPRGSRGRGGRERPTTTWRINPAEGESYTVETAAGAPSGSAEEAQARFARNTADQEALNRGMAADRRVGEAQQAQQGVQQLRQGAQQQVYRLAVKPEALTDVPAENELAASLGSKRIADPAGVRILGPDEAPAPGEQVYFHGGNLEGPIQPGMFVTPNEGSAQTIASLNERLANVQDVRQQGARQGRMFGPEVGGGRATRGGARQVDASATQRFARELAAKGDSTPVEDHWNILTELGGLVGLTRTIPTSMDAGGIFRNTAVLGASEPKAWARAAQAQVEALVSAGKADALQQAVKASPFYQMATERWGWRVNDWGPNATARVPERSGIVRNAKIAGRVMNAPGIKDVLEGSERSLAIGKNVMGMDVIDKYAQEAMARLPSNQLGPGGELDKIMTPVVRVINHANGWSELARGKDPFGVFFSLPYTLSRFQVLTDPLVETLKGNPAAAGLAWKNFRNFLGANAAMAGLLAYTGEKTGAWSVSLDPTSSDFGQLKVGNTRFDTMAGLGPIFKTVARLGADASQGDVIKGIQDLTRFFENKETPLFKMFTDAWVHERLPDASAAKNALLPMLVSGMWDTLKEGENPLVAAASGAAGEVGIGTNTYKTATDVANQTAQQKYGRAYDDLTREERLGVIGSAPDKERKQLTSDERKSYVSDRKAAGYQDYWSADRKAQFYKDNPELGIQAWYFDNRNPQDAESVDRVLALGIPGKEVRFPGTSIDITRDDKARAAWDASKDKLQYYTYDIVEKNKQATARRMYSKDWEKLTDTQQSSVVTNIHERLLDADEEIKAWMYWWGKTKSLKGTSAIARFRSLQERFGPGADVGGLGDKTGQLLTKR